MKAIEVEKLRVELNKAWVRLDEVESTFIEVERCIDSLREDICEESSAGRRSAWPN